jgi:hypothetical protein
MQIAQQIGLRRLVSLVGVALLAGGLAREWSARARANADEEDDDEAGSS